MVITSLNIWSCRIPKIFDFIKKNSRKTDIFCFQEVLKGGIGNTEVGGLKNSFEKIESILPKYVGYFVGYGEGGYYGKKDSSLDFKYGISFFIKKNIRHENLSGVKLFDYNKKWSDHPGKLAAGAIQAIKIGEYTVFNVHGLWQEGTFKVDTEARFEQLEIIKKFILNYSGKKIICGDFNVRPDTKFLKYFEDNYRNLIKEYKIKSTRSFLYTKELSFADYVFVGNNIDVVNFHTQDVAISDHLPVTVELKG